MSLNGAGARYGECGIHVADEQEERLVARGQTLQLGDGHVVAVLGLVGAAVVMIGAPAGEAQVVVIAAAGRVALEADAGGLVASVVQHFGQHRNAVHDLALAQRDDAGAEHVAAGQHAGIAGRGGNMRGEAAFKRDAAIRVLGDVGGGQAAIAVVAHMVAAQAVDSEEQKVRLFLGHARVPLSKITVR